MCTQRMPAILLKSNNDGGVAERAGDAAVCFNLKMKKTLTIIFKPTSQCNLRCRYCFAHRNRDLQRAMSETELSDAIEWAVQYAAERKVDEVVWLWHGGEPMLVGAVKFRRLTEKVRDSFKRIGLAVVFRIQTNLTLLNQDWIDVFKQSYCRAIGVSLDFRTGARVDAKGQNHDDEVLRNILLLRQNGVHVGVATLVTPQNIGLVREMYDFYKEYELSFKTMRFFPSTNPMPLELSYATSDQDYAKFLCSLYDIWTEDDNPRIRVLNLLEMATGLIRGERRVCSAESGGCYRNYLCIEAGGEIFNCGRYDAPEHRIGTIYDSPTSIAEAIDRRSKRELPPTCLKCSYFHLCHGGCPFEMETSGRFLDCETTKIVLHHIANDLKSRGIALKVDPCS